MAVRPVLHRVRHAFARLLIAAGMLPAGGALPAQQAPERAKQIVLVVPVTGTIGPSTVALVRRAIREGESSGATAIVFTIDTPGGRLDSIEAIQAQLREVREHDSTIAYVQGRALSAGAYLALACQQIYMTPSGEIGAVTPIAGMPGSVADIPDSDVRRKLISVLRAELRGLIQQRKSRLPGLELVGEAMVDPDLRVYSVVTQDANGVQQRHVVDEERIRELEGAGQRILQREPLGGRGQPPLTLTAAEAQAIGLSSGTISSLEELVRDVLALPMDDVVRLQETWSEDAAVFLDGMKPFLFVIGFLLLILEFKTPGFALPGALGLLLLGLAMFGSYLTGLAEFTEILLFFAGIGLIAVEVFVMPGMIVFGALGFLSLVFGLIASQQTFVVPATAAERDILLDNLLNMTWLILLVVAGAVLLWRLLPHIPVLNRVLLQPPDPAAFRLAGTPGGGFVDLSRWIGREAETVTDLRPAGIAEVDGERLDAVAEGGFVARGTRVRIVAARLNQVVVEPAASPAGERGEIAIGFLVLLLMIGLALTLAEIFFLSFGILGTLAAVSLVSSVFLAFTNHGQAVGFLFLAVASIGAPLVVLYGMKWLPRTRLGRALILSGPSSAEVTGAGADPGLGALLGRTGAAESDLRPAGIARIDGRRVDVVTRGEMLERGTPLRVVDVTANRVVVARHAPAHE